MHSWAQQGRRGASAAATSRCQPCLQQELQPCPAVLVLTVREDKAGMGRAKKR